MELKGKTQLLKIYQYINRTNSLGTATIPSEKMIGRADALDAFDQAVQSLRSEAPVATLVVEGEAGLGKSRLLQAYQERAVSDGMTVLSSAGVETSQVPPPSPCPLWKAVHLPHEQGCSYRVVRELIMQGLNLNHRDAAAQIPQTARPMLAGNSSSELLLANTMFKLGPDQRMS